jgi:sec-independent protein translocase protein TatA
MGFDNPIHIVFLLIVLLLVFGAKRLPEMGRSLGEGMRGFKDSISGDSAPSTTHSPLSAIVAEPSVAQVAQPVEARPAAQEAPLSTDATTRVVSAPRAA